jgi:hypothetical protein
MFVKAIQEANLKSPAQTKAMKDRTKKDVIKLFVNSSIQTRLLILKKQ